MEALSEGPDATPWTFTKAAEELGGNQYQDLTDDVPTDSEWRRAQNLEEENPPVRHRFRGKRPAEAVEEEEPEEQTVHVHSVVVIQNVARQNLETEPCTPLPGTRRRSRMVGGGARVRMGLRRDEFLESGGCCSGSGNSTSRVTARATAFSYETSRPSSRGALKRQAIEVSEKRMTESERQAL